MSGLTKILIVLQLVFSVALSVLLVLLVSRQDNYKAGAEAANARALGSEAALVDAQRQQGAEAAQINDAQKTIDNLNAQLAALRLKSAGDLDAASTDKIKLESEVTSDKAEVARLNEALEVATKNIAAKDKELADLRPQVAGLTKDNGELYRKLNEAQNQLLAADNTIKKLQEAVATNNTPGGAMAPTGNGGQVQMLTSGGGNAASQINAAISSVGNDKGRTLIEFPLGTRDGIQQNTRLFIYRGNNYVADATVERTTPDSSVAVVTTAAKGGGSVQKGDIVSTLGQ